jgi:hypothetical protein
LPVSNWIFAFVLLGVVPAVFFYILLEPMRALKKDRRDILAHGQKSIGTVVAIDERAAGRSSLSYVVTVEFTLPEYREPVRFETIFSGSSEVNKLGVYQQVPIHYREQMPLEAVIDEFVK